jgi:hypothetical protein
LSCLFSDGERLAGPIELDERLAPVRRGPKSGFVEGTWIRRKD